VKIKAPKDLWAGLMFIAFGLGFVIVAQHYGLGTAVRVGPGYFPTVLGGILTLLGLIVLGQAFVVHGTGMPTFRLRPVIIVLVAICLFGVLVRSTGLVPATVTLVIVSAFASHEFNFKGALVLAALLTVFSVAVFYYGLGLPFKLWPGH